MLSFLVIPRLTIMDIPEWPAGEGPRILTLIGNDITVDIRSRKTAASLSRSGFSVIAMGVTSSKQAASIESHHGAFLCRYPITEEFKSIPFIFRFSNESIKYLINCLVSYTGNQIKRARIHRTETDESSIKAIFGKYKSRTGMIFLKTKRKILLGSLWFVSRRFSRITWRRSWKWVLPEMHRYEKSLGPVIDQLKPDLIHVHDIFHLGLAARAIQRASQNGRNIKLVYDIHEYIPGLPIGIRKRCGYEDLENEYAHMADALVTVSPGLKALTEKRFSVPVTIVLNAPDLISATTTKPLREIVNISSRETLMVYVGGIAPHRGAELILKTMKDLNESIHLVFVSASMTGYIATLKDRSIEMGIDDRVHFAPFVEPEAVVSYISSADLSLIPLSREIENYEVALPNKLFQSIHAGVPVVVSNNPDMERFVKQSGIGEVFLGGDSLSMSEAISKVVNDPATYAVAIKDENLLSKTSWEHQIGLLLETYENLGIATHD